MNISWAASIRQAASLLSAFLLAAAASAQSVQHLTVPQIGGMPGAPVMTESYRSSNGVVLTWDGPAGYYQLFQKSSVTNAKWIAVGGATNLSRRAIVTPGASSAFFKISGPSSQYAGSQACLECHRSIVTNVSKTIHAGAFTNATFVAFGGQTNSSCLPCHTVGYGQPTGFINATRTPLLAGVQCENCHGPAANHAANPDNIAVRPRVELSSAVCGGCHTDSHHPTFDNWKSSAHSGLVADMNPTNRIDSCGRCHSGSARSSLVRGKKLPTGDANVPIGCATCHDPHQKTANTAQLRNPVTSTNDYYVTASGTFTNQYKAGVSICAQCHNDAGASYATSAAPPHFSPQYNMLLGMIGELNSGSATARPGTHGVKIQKQCVACHMASTPFKSEFDPADTGHGFGVGYESCRDCHPSPELLVRFTSTAINYKLQNVKAALDLWATSKSAPTLRSKYGTKAWEYTEAGSLSGGGAGPTAAEQASIPVAIQKARFNIYLVLHDGSYGTHNPPLSIELLDTAYDWVQQELIK